MVTMDKIYNFCKTRGLIFQGSEIYDGLGNTWDYGPIGVEIKNNIKKEWWNTFVHRNRGTYGVDASILMNPKVWEASGHIASFSDPKIDCKECKTRHRADHLIEEFAKKNGLEINADAMSEAEMEKFIQDNDIKCPKCGKKNFTPVREFKLMFETSRGTIEGEKDVVYLRPETAQGEFVNFLNVQRTMRAKVPFGIAQIGKAFRNEITPGNFIFRTIEFEQMEHQLFCKEEDGFALYDLYKQKAKDFLLSIGIKEENLRFKDHDKLAHYAKCACDIQFNYPMGWSELNGIHHRGTWDLSRHQEFSKKSMLYLDPITNEKFLPNVIEYSIGADRLMLAVLCNAFEEEQLENGETRNVLHLHPKLACHKIAILPLQKNLSEKANEVFDKLSQIFHCDFDESGSIGKRYRRQDEVGTPFCLTVDFQTLDDGTVTLRDRDTMQQERLTLEEVIQKVNLSLLA